MIHTIGNYCLRQVHIIKPVITTRLTMWLADCAWKWGLEARGDSPGVRYPPHEKHFNVLSCTSFCFLLPLVSLIHHFSFYFFLTILLTCITVCLSLSQPLSLTAWFLLLFLSSLPSTPSVPSSMLCLAVSHSILMQAHSFIILLYSYHLSCPHSLSPVQLLRSLSSLSLRHSINNSGAALWPVPLETSLL